MKFFWEAMKDWKTYAFAIIYMGTDGSLYAFSLFLPTIIAELGYTATRANLLSVPPYAAAAIMTICVGAYADKTKRRGLCNIVMSLFGIVGFCMLIGSNKAGVKYAGTFLGKLSGKFIVLSLI
jgi:cyanate permease